MDIDEFERHLDTSKNSKPKWFAMEGERPCTGVEISALEQRLGVALASEYKSYLARYGGGYIGHINVFSANAESEWYLPKGNRFIPSEFNYVAVTDGETGEYYGFKVDAGVCSDAIYYWHFEDGDVPVRTANSFLEFVVSFGLP
jgi:hypothetical protein